MAQVLSPLIDLQSSPQEIGGLAGASLEIFNLAWNIQSRRVILIFSIYGPLGLDREPRRHIRKKSHKITEKPVEGRVSPLIQPPKFQCFSSQFALHGLRTLEVPWARLIASSVRDLVATDQKNSRRLELSISKNTPHGRWRQGPGSVDPRFPEGLPFPVPEIPEFVAFRDSGKIFQQFSRDFPGVFLENPRTHPGNSHSLLEFSEQTLWQKKYPPPPCPKDPSVLKIVQRANSLRRENLIRKSPHATESAQKCFFLGKRGRKRYG